MSTVKPEYSGSHQNLGVFIAVGLLLCAVGRKLSLWFAPFWQEHKIIILICVFLSFGLGIWFLYRYLLKKLSEKEYLASVTASDETSVYLGTDSEKNPVSIQQKTRTMHTQVIGTTSAGKTESVILPWAIRDLETGAGLLIIDGKSERSFLDKFYAYVVKTGRQTDFRLFSFSDIKTSSTFNPLSGGSVSEVGERVFSSFTFENEYYRNVQYKVFQLFLLLLKERNTVPTFKRIHQFLTNSELLVQMAEKSKDPYLKQQIQALMKESPRTRAEKLSGLEASVSHFAMGEVAPLFNADEPQISFETALQSNHICYFQLPSMYFPFLAEATGKLVLQSFQNAVAKRHIGIEKKTGFFSCYLDDFQDYIYPGFGSLLNKARSANIGVVFSHQSLGDLEKVSPAFRNVVLTNTNLKCVMRNNDPDTAEYFSKSFGTETTEKITERRQKSIWGEVRTGEGSIRKVEQYKVHPNEIRALGTGQGFVSIPHLKGVKTLKVHFERRSDLPVIALPEVFKKAASDLTIETINQSEPASKPDKIQSEVQIVHEI